MTTVVLVLNQDGISELIQTANDLQSKVESVLGKNKGTRDRIADAGATTLLEVAREKLPIIMEEGDEEGIKASEISAKLSSKFGCFLLNLFIGW